jgi:hypothetical protein
MTLPEFIQSLKDRHSRGTLYDSNGRVENDIMEIYTENSKTLKEEFFGGIEQNLDRDNFTDLHKYLGLLTVSPFDEIDHERFQKMATKSIGKLESASPLLDLSELAKFVWVLLDHMLHHWTMSDENLMMERLREFKINLKKFEVRFKEDIDLLYQKLEHFGVE